jgi:hypothetical protein
MDRARFEDGRGFGTPAEADAEYLYRLRVGAARLRKGGAACFVLAE